MCRGKQLTNLVWGLMSILSNLRWIQVDCDQLCIDLDTCSTEKNEFLSKACPAPHLWDATKAKTLPSTAVSPNVDYSSRKPKEFNISEHPELPQTQMLRPCMQQGAVWQWGTAPTLLHERNRTHTGALWASGPDWLTPTYIHTTLSKFSLWRASWSGPARSQEAC